MNLTKINRHYLLASALLLSGLILSVFIPVKFLLNFYVDDGYFYLKIAKNFASGYGSSFDTFSLTNGYHPLWFLILSFIYFIFSFLISNSTPDILLRVSFFVHYIMIFLSCYFIYKSFKLINEKEYINRTLLFIALILTPIATRNFGIEIHLTTLLLAIYIWMKVREIIYKENLLYYKIIIFCLLGLTRIDFFFTLVPILILFNGYNKNIKVFIQNLIYYSIPLCVVLAGYFLINYYYFGHIFSISSELKNSFPNLLISLNFERLVYYIQQRSFTLFNLTAFFVVFVIFLISRYFAGKRDYRELSNMVIQLFIGFIAFFSLNFLFNLEMFQEWYFAGPIFISAFAFTFIVNNRFKMAYIIAVSFYIISIFYIYNARVTSSKFATIYDYSHELQNLVPENEKIFQMDYSGIVGFLSDRKVVNGDGLVNSFEYYEYFRSSRLREYLKKYDIKYYSAYTCTIDSSAKKVYDNAGNMWWGMPDVTFSLEKVRYRREQKFDSYKFSATSEWLLISLE